jgi:hypothetical protein
MSNIYQHGLPHDATFDQRSEWFNVRRHQPAYFCGLDLGQSSDFSALAIVERRGDDKSNYQFVCSHLQRWQLRTSYPDVVSSVVEIMQTPVLHSGPQRPMLLVDRTGVGAPVFDLFKRTNHQSYLEGILITGGTEVSKSNGTWRVPKRNLISSLQVMLQSQRLKISGKLPEAATLIGELQNFRAKISDAGRDSYGAGAGWIVGNNDDLLLALSMALWGATEVQISTYGTPFRLI